MDHLSFSNVLLLIFTLILLLTLFTGELDFPVFIDKKINTEQCLFRCCSKIPEQFVILFFYNLFVLFHPCFCISVVGFLCKHFDLPEKKKNKIQGDLDAV